MDNKIQILKKVRKAANYSKKQMKKLNQERPFVIVVCGAFSTGKSSLINALFGCNLPTGNNPITKRITKIAYGITERIIICDKKKGEEYEVSHDTANAVITYGRQDPYMETLEIRYELPSSLLKRGVVIIDTPGFEDDAKEMLDKITQKEIKKADFCIVNFACNHFGDKKEREFLENLQTLTGGNFVMVLNCSNYLNGLEALRDLEKRADMILGEFGNKRVGYGKYFVVDSRRKQSDLDGLDKWLEELVDHDGKSIQQDAILSRTAETVKNALKEGDDAFTNNLHHISVLQAIKEKDIETQIHAIQRGRHKKVEELRGRQNKTINEAEAELLEKVRNGLSGISPEAYNDNAFATIERSMAFCYQQVYKEVSSRFPETKNVQPSIGGINMQITQAVLLSRERSYFSLDRYILGAREYYYNDYLTETMKKVREVTIPEFRSRLNQYFQEAETLLITTLCIQEIDRQDQEIKETYTYLEKLSQELLNLKISFFHT